MASIDAHNLRARGGKDFRERRFFALDLPAICFGTRY
jgi:hypothetical protein